MLATVSDITLNLVVPVFKDIKENVLVPNRYDSAMIRDMKATMTQKLTRYFLLWKYKNKNAGVNGI